MVRLRTRHRQRTLRQAARPDHKQHGTEPQIVRCNSPAHVKNRTFRETPAKHVFIEAANSWASVRQAKSVDQTALGPHFATATSQEMERALEIIVARLAGIRNTPGTVQTPEGNKLIFPGSVWETESNDQHHQFPAQQLLVLDYNRGNQIAMAVAMDFRHITNSPVRIPVQLQGRAQTASALTHRVSSIDIGQRTTRNTGTVVLDSLARVNSALLAAIDV